MNFIANMYICLTVDYKMKITLQGLSVILLLTGCGSSVQMTDSMKADIKAHNICINVNYIYPMNGPMITDNNGYSLKVKGDSVFSYLPYFGVAYSLPYAGRGKGLIFNDRISGFTEESTKGGNINIDFKVTNDEDYYQFHLTLTPHASASISINSNHRQTISYSGNWQSNK